MTYVFLILALLFGSNADTDNVRVALDLDRSTLTWRGKKVIGNTHHGTVDLSSGYLELDKGDLAGGEFELDMTSLRNQDLGPRMGSRLINHLKSEDFFDVDNFPKSSIIITKSRKVDEGVFDVFADLTIKNITKEINFQASITDGDAKAYIRIDRTEFDVKYGSGSFFSDLGDRTIADEFSLDVMLYFQL